MRAVRWVLVAWVVMAVVTACTANHAGTLSIQNGTSIDVRLVVNGSTVETVRAGSTLDPVGAALPKKPWVVEAISPSGRVLVTMTVGANAYLSATSGVMAGEDLACGRLLLWAGAPTTGGGTFIPNPAKPCD